MITRLHSIANRIFLTKSNVPCDFIEKGNINKFRVNQGNWDISQTLTSIEPSELNSPPLPENLINDIVALNSSTDIFSDTLTIPPSLPEVQLKNLSLSLNFSEPSYPLLNSMKVRAAVLGAITKQGKTRIQLHKLAIEVYDYDLMAFHVFFHSCLAYLLQSDISSNGMRRLFSSSLPAFDSFLLHSSGITINNRAALFLAPDAGGKSTALSLGNLEYALCDDYNILSMRNGMIEAHAAPWGRLCKGPITAPLGGLFFLEKANAFSINPIPANEGVARIWNENYRLYKNLDKKIKTKAFQILYDICHITPIYLMQFPIHYIDWEAIDGSMR